MRRLKGRVAGRYRVLRPIGLTPVSAPLGLVPTRPAPRAGNLPSSGPAPTAEASVVDRRSSDTACGEVSREAHSPASPEGAPAASCDRCSGVGGWSSSHDGVLYEWTTCPACSGSGKAR